MMNIMQLLSYTKNRLDFLSSHHSDMAQLEQQDQNEMRLMIDHHVPQVENELYQQEMPMNHNFEEILRD